MPLFFIFRWKNLYNRLKFLTGAPNSAGKKRVPAPGWVLLDCSEDVQILLKLKVQPFRVFIDRSWFAFVCVTDTLKGHKLKKNAKNGGQKR